MQKKILIPLIAGLSVVIGVVLFLVFRSKEASYFNIKILDTSGTVTVDRDGSSLEAYEGLKMRDKDHLKVGSDGFTRIDCDRETYSHFEHDSEASFIADSDKKLTINLIKGELVVELQRKLADNETLNIATPNTTLAIRGTVVVIKTTPDANGGTRTVNYCLEGKAEVISEDGTSNSIEAGEGWLIVTDETGNITENREAGAEEFEFSGINIEELKGAEDKPMVIKSSTPTLSDGDVAIDGTNFPDMIFRLHIMDTIDKDKNLVLSPDELSINTILVKASGITDLRGIEFFKDLETLDCSSNEITSLDLSRNTKLKSLYCRRNRLQSINISNCSELGYFTCDENELESLDVSGCGKLQHLECQRNKIKELNLSNLPELLELDCSYNSLLDVDVTKNPLLTYLSCSNNPLTTLDVSKNTSLNALYCYSDQLKKLDVSKNAQLQYLYAGENQIYSFDTSNNLILEEFSCYNCFLREIDVSNNIKLRTLICGSNMNLSSLDLSNNPELEDLQFPFTKISEIDLSKNPKLKYLNCLYCEGLKSLDISHNPKLNPENIDHSGIIINQ